jgi:hypothetical protein
MTAREWPVEHALAHMAALEHLAGLVQAWWNEAYPADIFNGESGDRSAFAVVEIRKALDAVEKAKAIPPDQQKPAISASVLASSLAELVEASEARDIAESNARSVYRDHEDWDKEQWEPVEAARESYNAAMKRAKAAMSASPEPDPINGLLAKLEEEAGALEHGATFHDGPLHGTSKFNAYCFAEDTIRRLTGRDPQ